MDGRGFLRAWNHAGIQSSCEDYKSEGKHIIIVEVEGYRIFGSHMSILFTCQQSPHALSIQVATFICQKLGPPSKIGFKITIWTPHSQQEPRGGARGRAAPMGAKVTP